MRKECLSREKGVIVSPKPKSSPNKTYSYIVPAVDRAVRILGLLKENARGMTIAEVTEKTGWHKSSVHKILVTLNHHGMLDRNEATKQYSLGVALVGYGQFVLNNFDMRQEVRSLLRELADFSGETANFSILSGKQVIILQSIESTGDLRVVPPVGTMDTLARKSNGKAILASLPETQAMNIVQNEGLPAFTKKSITSEKVFQQELAKVREQGYATDFEEFQEGIHAVSAAVFNREDLPFGTVSIVGPSFRLTKERMRLCGRECAGKAARLSGIFRTFPREKSESSIFDGGKHSGGL